MSSLKHLLQALAGLWLCASLARGSSNGHCPPLGPVLPAPTKPSTNAAVQSAASLVKAAFLNMTSQSNSSAVSLSVKSIHESAAMVDLHYTPLLLNSSGTSKVDNETVYRLGSVSKVFTVFGILLAKGVEWNDPVTKFLPELRQLKTQDGEPANSITTVAWDDVTIGSLASHMAGVGTDLPNDLAAFPRQFAVLGLPDLNTTGSSSSSSSYTPGCGGVLGLPPCTKAEFLRDFGKRHPVYSPFTTPVYSNVGLSILGFVLEAVSNKTYADYIQGAIFAPLSMTSALTGGVPANVSKSFIPAGPPELTYYGVELGYPDFAGGYYASTADLALFGASILQHRLLGAAATRRWLKPLTATSSRGTMLGGPWEIYRVDNATADGRLLELYTKAGDVGLYHASLCLVPDYDLVVTILSGGPDASSGSVAQTLSAVLELLLPAVEAAGKAEAGQAYVGNYTDTATNSSMSLALDDGPGLAVSEWTVRGVDVVALYPALLGVTDPNVTVSARLYPTDLEADCQASWRAVFDVGSLAQLAANDAQFIWAQDSCQTWSTTDRLVYGFDSLDDVVFDLDPQSRRAVNVTARGFRVQMQRE